VAQGQAVQVKIIEMDAERRRLSLSLKRVEDSEAGQPRGEDAPPLALSEEVFSEGPATPLEEAEAEDSEEQPVAEAEAEEPAAEAPVAEAEADEPVAEAEADEPVAEASVAEAEPADEDDEETT
jgi:transcriptional accessory protein Tex/SPT6